MGLNLPGSPQHTPLLPWVSRVRQDGVLAAGVPRFIDDLRLVGPTEDECWHTAHTIACRYSYLGVSLHKTRPPSQHPGAWAGAYVTILEDGIGVTCGLDKWAKAKMLLQELQTELNTRPLLNHKGLEQKRGFFVHLQSTYPCLMPFLKGFHLILDGWRPGRDAKGWKQRDTTHNALAMDMVWGLPHPSAPEYVTAVPRLQADLYCLTQLIHPRDPPIRYV